MNEIAKPLIRYACRDDIYDIAVFLDACWKSAYRDIVDDKYLDSMSVDDRYKGLLTRYDCGASEFLLMFDDNGNGSGSGSELIGVSVFGESFTEGYKDDGEITGLYLQPEYIGKGYGHHLFVETESLLMAKGYSHCVIDMLDGNSRALGFYLDHGYEEVAASSIKLGDAEYSLAILRKSLLDDNQVTR